MLTGLRAKVTQYRGLREKLLATGDALLHEDSPCDTYRGVKGRDRLGAPSYAGT